MTDSTRVFHDEADEDDEEEGTQSETNKTDLLGENAIQQDQGEGSLIDLKADAPIINLD